MKPDLDKFYRENYNRQVNVVNKVVRNRATSQDIVQQAYVRALTYLDSFNPEVASFHKWFNTLLYNTMRSGKPECEIDEDLFNSAGDFQGYIEGEVQEVSNKKHRKILELAVIKGYSEKEIQSVLAGDVKLKSVRMVVNRFKRGLVDKHAIDSGCGVKRTAQGS